MKIIEKVAVFGGTFNPPHIGHVRAAERFYAEILPDRLLIMPAFIPPHKQVDIQATPEERIEMCRLAFSHIRHTEISDIEIKRGGKSYTSHTLEELSSEGRKLYFLCGTDMFLSLDSWYRPEVIFKLATICYIRRENDNENDIRLIEKRSEYIKKFNAEIIEIRTDVLEISSSEIRSASKNNVVSDLLPASVYSYIKEKEIYGSVL